MTVRERAVQNMRRWRQEPLTFAWEVLHIELDQWQKDALESCGGAPNPRRRIAMQACTGPGKSLELAIIGWHRLVCFGGIGDHPKGAAVSGEGHDNLRDNLWAELARLRDRSEFLKAAFAFNQAKIYAVDHPNTWFLASRSYPKGADANAIGNALSGLHSPYPFLLLDEIGNMPVEVGQKASQIFTGGAVDALIAAAGNPVSKSGLLYAIATRERHLWHLTKITSDPLDANRTPRVDIKHAQEQIDLHGRDNPWIKATFLGEFPDQGFNNLLSIEDVEAAMARVLADEDYRMSQKRIGLDVARFGDDRTVLFPRQGLQAFECAVMRGARGHEIASRLAVAKTKWGSELELFDAGGGYAASAIDYYEQAGYTATPVDGSGKANDPRYFNRRAEMWWEGAQWVKKGGALPNDPELVSELTEPTYTYKNGKILIEPKDLIKKRLKRSPDKADALFLTFALPEMPTEMALPFMGKRGKLKSDYDPLRDLESEVKHDYDPIER